jgi:hypothetical protein
VRFDTCAYSADEANHLKNYPKIQYILGVEAWTRQETVSAAIFFRNAVSKDVLFIDGWLRLAEAEAAMGHIEKAKSILSFTIDSTQNVYRWRWPQMLLARELGMEKVLHGNANYLLSCGLLKQDTLQLLHSQFNGNASAVVSVLNQAHWESYLEWLMRWSMVEESLTVWEIMKKGATPEKETALRYANFLLHNKHITESKGIWQEYTGTTGITNPGFETEYTERGFDWRFLKEKEGICEVTRVNRDAREGDYALKIQFNGRENLNLYHFYQIFTVDSLATYRLTYAWKSHGITTDEGPFIEIIGYDKEGVYAAGPKITGTQPWREVSLEFDMPEGIRAGIIRLRRQPSHRFDSKIRGTVWLDDFQLEKIGEDSRRFYRKMNAVKYEKRAPQDKNLFLSTRSIDGQK